MRITALLLATLALAACSGYGGGGTDDMSGAMSDSMDSSAMETEAMENAEGMADEGGI